MMQVILSNSKHPEYGQATIPFPLAQDQYEDCVELLEKLEIGDAVERDCKVEEIQGGLSILKRLEKVAINIDELDYWNETTHTGARAGTVGPDRRISQQPLFGRRPL